MRTKIRVEYVEPKQIVLFVDKNSIILISDEKKKILASEIYNIFDYKKDKKYELEEVKEYKKIPLDYDIYLKECYDLIKGIIKDIQ
jgi:hypothetical protein